MRIGLTPHDHERLRRLSRMTQVVKEDLILEILREGIEAREKAAGGLPPVTDQKTCLCPSCGEAPYSRGVCPRHYQRIRYFVARRQLTEGWLVRKGRMLPSKSVPVDPSFIETLETLPSAELPDMGRDTAWMWDWPASKIERDRLQAEALLQKPMWMPSQTPPGAPS